MLTDLLDRREVRAHFVGIGGAGMAPLASIAAARGWNVTGCDQSSSTITGMLAEMGITVYVGHDREHVINNELVVVSSAVSSDSDEFLAAISSGIPVVKRSMLVGALTRRSRAICIAGTHGKTTTTAMAAVAAIAGGANPSVLVGAAVPGIGVGGRTGSDDLLVVEADEYDGSFLRFQPATAVITNVEADHLDFYTDLKSIKSAFQSFLRLVSQNGRTIVCADDSGALELAPPGSETYGIADDSHWRIVGIASNDVGGNDFKFRDPGNNVWQARLPIPGKHNVLNAVAALAAISTEVPDFPAAIHALATFRGAARRFESKGVINGIDVRDDYGHHPTEVVATLKAARSICRGRLWCVFQPHTFHRTHVLFDDFLESFSEADHVILVDIYSPAGRETPIAGVTSQSLIAKMRHPSARYADSFDSAVEIIAADARAGDLVLTMGAGTITTASSQIVQRLARV